MWQAESGASEDAQNDSGERFATILTAADPVQSIERYIIIRSYYLF